MLFDLANHWERPWGLVWGWVLLNGFVGQMGLFYFLCSVHFSFVFGNIPLCTQIHGKSKALSFQLPSDSSIVFSLICEIK